MRNSIRSFRFRFGLLTVAIAALLVPATTASAGGGCTFKLAQHPEVGSPPFDVLHGIDAVLASEVWAVGSSGAFGKPLIERWNGTKWSILAAPDKGATTELYDITVITHRDAWAVGYFTPAGGGHIRTLIEHWNGTKWSVVPSPNPIAGADNFLKGVDGVNVNDVWAVGSNGRPGTKTIIEHYNGSKWVSVHGASLPLGGDLQDVSAISSTNVVAVGSAASPGGTDGLVERFDGGNWTRETVPTEATAGANLIGVSAASASVQWAVGSRTGPASLQTLTLRNTGSGWDVVNSPNVGTDKINFFSDVSALSATNAWAVGEYENSSFVRRTLIAHFTNGSWQRVASPNQGSSSNRLEGVDTASGGVWAVGTANHPIGSSGLIEPSC